MKNPRKPCCQLPECYNLPTQAPTQTPSPRPTHKYTGVPTQSPPTSGPQVNTNSPNPFQTQSPKPQFVTPTEVPQPKS